MQNEFNESVDLTEDEDVNFQNTIIHTEFGLVPLPPLTPIPRVNIHLKPVDTNSVPTLTKIESKCETYCSTPNLYCNTNAAPTGSPLSVPSTQAVTSPGGKTVLIKKNNTLYKIVLPHNVMPVYDSGGPVVINIPEVGPLVLKLDPQLKKQPLTKPTLEPFSLNFDDILEKASTGEIMKVERAKKECTSTEKVSSLEKIFHCWRPLISRTRTKHCSTFNGFSKRECIYSRRCLNQLKLVITKLKSHQYVLNYQKVYKNKSNIASNFDSLLMTKKIVVLNNGIENKSKKVTKKRKSFLSRSKSRKRVKKINQNILEPIISISRCDNLENRYEHLIKPCFVSMTRVNELDDMLKNNKNTISIRSRNIPCLSQILKSNKKMNLAERKTLYLSRLISDVKEFNTEMAFIKPVLVINRFNYSIVNFSKEFSKSNIIFSVGKDCQFPKELLECRAFSDAVVHGFVKLVDIDILCGYLRGEIGPPNTLLTS